MAHLHFQSGPLAGKRAHLKAPRISLGRALGNSIRIDDESIAARHLVLIREDDGYSLYIDASKPPVAINGKQVINETLKDGDHLQIGAIKATFSDPASRKPAANPLDFWSDQPPVSKEKKVESKKPQPANPLDFLSDQPRVIKERKVESKKQPEPEILSLDDAEELPLEDDRPVRRGNRGMRAALALGLLMLMLGGSLLAFRKEIWKDVLRPAATAQTKNGDEKPPKDEPEPIAGPNIDEPAPPDAPIPIGAGDSGIKMEGKIHRTKNFKSHQEAVDAAEPGDAVIFDSADARPILVLRPLRDVQFISGAAAWELHADLVDCQFILHEAKRIEQRSGKLERCVFFRCPMKHSLLTHTDAVSFYFDERSPLHPKDNPGGGKSPILFLTGFVRNVLIMNPHSGSATADKRFDMHWCPSLRIHATDPGGDGRGTYILAPAVFGQRAWTPHEITHGNGITYAHLTTDGNAWADPVLDVLRGRDCVVLCTSLGSEQATTAEQYNHTPKILKYHDHPEFGHDNGPAFRGAAMTIVGLRNRVVAHGDARKPWTVGRKIGLPGLHYADGIVASDPFIKQYATERGGLSLNLAEMKSAFVMQPGPDGVDFLSNPQQADGSPLYSRDGPLLHQPTFMPLKDLRIDAGRLFEKILLQDMTGKPPAEIEKALAADKSIYLGPGTYELKQFVRAGFIAGAGMERTILKWPEGTDCAQRGCRGMINCTVSGGHFGFNSQAGAGMRTGNANALFLRTRFVGQKEAGVNLHTALFQTWQDCEFVGCKTGFTHGAEKGPGLYKGDKGATGGVTIDNLNLCNCTFRDIKQRAIDIVPDDPRLGHVGVHNCLFESIGDAAIRIEGGQTHLVQQCRIQFSGRQSYTPAISIVSNGVLAVSHVDIDCKGVKGNPVCVSLKGLAAVSRCEFKGMPTSLKCDGLLAADRVTGDGRLQTNKDSLLCRCRFKNMDLPDGAAIAKVAVKDNDDPTNFADVTALTLPASLDKAPPAAVSGQKARTVDKQRRLEWNLGDSPSTGVAFCLIESNGKEIARVPFEYEPPSDFHSPILTVPRMTSFTDLNPANQNYTVLAVNGLGIASNGNDVSPRRLGPARARFLTRDGDLIGIKDFPPLIKGKVPQITDEAGNRLPFSMVGVKGQPNVIYFELGEIVGAP